MLIEGIESSYAFVTLIFLDILEAEQTATNSVFFTT